MRKLPSRAALLMVAALVLGLLPAAIASAHNNEIVSDPTVDCDVNGSVALSGHDDNTEGGLDNNASDGRYDFVDTSLVCAGTHPDIGAIAGVYSVTASGATTDIDHSGSGEDCAQGGNDARGTLTAELVQGVGPQSLEGDVSFHRLETAVVAFGELDDGDNTAPFSAEMLFTPTDGDCVTSPAVEAQLTGLAQIGTQVTDVPEQP